MQTTINSATDVVVLGDIAREKDWPASVRKAALDEQRALGARRKKTLRVLDFADAVAAWGADRAVKSRAVVAEFTGGVPPPGPLRTRGACFGRTLIFKNPATGAFEKGFGKGRYWQFFADDEDGEGDGDGDDEEDFEQAGEEEEEER